MFVRRKGNWRYKAISTDNAGIVLRVPRYSKTGVYIGTYDECKEKGLSPKGTKSCFRLPGGEVIMDGFLAEPSREASIELQVKGTVRLTKNSLDELWEEMNKLIAEGD